MRVSLIIPVKNEESSIAGVLDCILKQSLLPDEVVVADGGSTDRTVKIIYEYTKKLPLKVLSIGPSYPGKGRNAAIREATYPIIALTDAGLTLKSDWLENLVKPFERDETIDVVFGGYRPQCTNSFQKAMALFVACDKDPQYNFRFPVMPSMAIKKSVYTKLGGCPEDLRAAEDSVFFRRLFEHKVNYAVAEKAIIDWEMDNSWRYLVRKNFQAAKYEILSGYIRKRSLLLMSLYPFMFLVLWGGITFSSLLVAVFPILFGTRVSESKRMDPELYGSLISSLSGILWLALVTLIADISHIAGNSTGFYCRYKAQHKQKLRLWRGARFK